MSQVKEFLTSSDTVRRIKTDGSTHEGCGKSKHHYVGRDGLYDYTSYIKFALDWTDVGQIVSARLNLYTDEYDTLGPAGEIGIFATPASGDQPTVLIYRAGAAWVEGSNVDGHFDSGDYVNPPYTTTGALKRVLTPNGADLLHSIDITAIVKAWAPSTVQGGGRAANYGIVLRGEPESTLKWSGWSREHTGGGGASERPTITLTYEYGVTIPNAPQNLVPAGTVASLATFEGDFSDVRATDTLQSTNIEIYDAAHVAASIAQFDDYVHHNAHGLLVGDLIYFTLLTGGTGLTTFTPYYVSASGFNANNFKVSAVSGGAVVDVTADYSAAQWSKRVGTLAKVASQSERVAAHFIVPKPVSLAIFATRTYRWRARCTDQESQTSPWTALVSFVMSNTVPNPPTLSPVSGSSYDSLNLVKFEGGTFSDPDAGDKLGAHQVQLSPFPNGDVRWDEADGILWDSGEVFDSLGATSWVELYGGQALLAGTYYWRARQWDTRQGVSNWTYATLILTADFSPDPGSYANVQTNPQAPWRILIRNLLQADGVTPTTGRGPGQLVAVLEEAKNVGASVVYNSPGELHFTLLKDDEQISVIEPKQVHYAVEFYSGDGWQEKFAGVIWDVDATEVDVVFKGIDYVALYDTVIDERYDPLKPDKSYTADGSFYSNVTIRTVVLDQLTRAHGLSDSWVGFIAIGAVATMDELVTVYSTMQPTLSFVAGLIDSHRQGTGKRSRIKVVKTTTGTYQLQIVDDPGVIRNDLAMYYGELVQGYRLIVFGANWANVQHVVGRNREGAKVVYNTISGQPFQPSQSIYGRIATVAVMDGVQDQNDLNRRGLQAAIQSAKLGKNIAIGIRTEYLSPLQGWDVCDIFPLTIQDGAIDTTRFGSGFWAAYACAWEATDIGEQSLVITFAPREDTMAPNPDLLVSSPVSTQPEWQLGWVPPAPVTGIKTANALRLSLDTGLLMDAGLFMDQAYSSGGLNGTGNIYFDVTTGNVYELQQDDTWLLVGGPPTVTRPDAMIPSTRVTLNPAGVAVADLTVEMP